MTAPCGPNTGPVCSASPPSAHPPIPPLPPPPGGCHAPVSPIRKGNEARLQERARRRSPSTSTPTVPHFCLLLSEPLQGGVKRGLALIAQTLTIAAWRPHQGHSELPCALEDYQENGDPHTPDARMKRPFSPSVLPNTELDRRGFGAGLGAQMDAEACCDTQDEGAVPDEQTPGGALPSALYRPKRERKQRRYTLCEVCNIQLNSAAQAQIHYNGKSHQKRLKQISNGKMPNNTASRRMSVRPRPFTSSLLQRRHSGGDARRPRAPSDPAGRGWRLQIVLGPVDPSQSERSCLSSSALDLCGALIRHDSPPQEMMGRETAHSTHVTRRAGTDGRGPSVNVPAGRPMLGTRHQDGTAALVSSALPPPEGEFLGLLPRSRNLDQRGKDSLPPSLLVLVSGALPPPSSPFPCHHFSQTPWALITEVTHLSPAVNRK
ncbi:hypothetical protein L3Q82_002657 [Scortum barcoo]|uniref:Uncharacterized protein n=1 Tax=Scortum barcoo TaxID=214431 RepID=A0ACB8VUJ1_9TELE|nr:hypothetical protein L3Q82_002657 [Scortum barcoo]